MHECLLIQPRTLTRSTGSVGLINFEVINPLYSRCTRVLVLWTPTTENAGTPEQRIRASSHSPVLALFSTRRALVSRQTWRRNQSTKHIPGTPDAETIPIRHQQLLRKLGWRLLPLCALIYLLNHLDCSNIGNAKVLDAETGEQTGMTDTGYSITLTQFAVAYALFDVPSNWILKRYARPAYWLGTLMLCWGAVTLGFARVDNRPTVMVLRVVIGVLEAGNLPWNGLPHHLLVPTGRAFHPHCLHSRKGATLAGAFGGCIACGVAFLNGKGGLEEFRWLFIIEGGSTVLIAPLVFLGFCLTTHPRRRG